MFRKGFLVICLMMASLVTTTVVHARELPGVVMLECCGTVRAESNESSKPSSGDSDKAAFEHHGCHGASSLMLGNAPADEMVVRLQRAYPFLQVAALLPRESTPGLRPPIV
ncbi:hypothetical protein SZ64_00100 [Erythrobacter sp. SG61-1L]|nr:hypothetical protein SZ64_00100 [Erythrobacter sp. SG61-1L]